MRTPTLSLRLVGRRLSLAAAASLTVALPLRAQQVPLPAAGDLVARYVELIGGREAILRHSSFRTRGSFEMPSAGIRGDLEIVQARPNRMMMRTTIPGVGEIAGGFDGSVGWAMDPMQGPRLLSGAELDARRDEADVRSIFRDSGSVARLETVERVDLGGSACYKVKISWKSGRESFDCYAVDGGLLVATILKEQSPMGTLEVTTLVSEYKDFGGLRRPTKLTASAMGQQQVMTITSVDYDVLDHEAFALPAAIRALVERTTAKAASNP